MCGCLRSTPASPEAGQQTKVFTGADEEIRVDASATTHTSQVPEREGGGNGSIVDRMGTTLPWPRAWMEHRLSWRGIPRSDRDRAHRQRRLDEPARAIDRADRDRRLSATGIHPCFAETNAQTRVDRLAELGTVILKLTDPRGQAGPAEPRMRTLSGA